MNTHLAGIALGLSLFCGATTQAGPPGAVEADSERGVLTSAADMVQAALMAAAEGDVARRSALLRTALAKDPDYAPARWHSGYVHLNDRWMSLEEVHEFFRADPRVAEYQRLRESLADTSTQDLLLARWCQDQKLMDEARFHWLNVLQVQPQHDEALRALKVQWYNGRLLTREEVAKQKRADFRSSRDTLNVSQVRKSRWEKMIGRWERAAAAGDGNLLVMMEADLAAEESPNVIPLLNVLLNERSRAPKNPQAFETVSRRWIDVLAKDPAHTKFVVLHAIGHPLESVRHAAADALKPRPREQYVPLLLACARFPVEFACSMLCSAGLSTVQYTLDVQGPAGDTQIQHVASLERVAGLDTLIPLFPHGKWLLLWGGESPEQAATTATWRHSASGNAQAMKGAVDQYNAVSEVINQRIADALARATGEDVAGDPRVWQAWWKEHLEDTYELGRPHAPGGQMVAGQPGGQGPIPGDQVAGHQQQPRPLQRFASTSNQYLQAPPSALHVLPWPDDPFTPNTSGKQYLRITATVGWWLRNFPGPAASNALDFYRCVYGPCCFQGSTLVWTTTGPRAIADIRPGDRVLSQSSSTGELAYKVVQQVTVREPAPMMKITAGGEEVVAALGHPFWAINERWVMAKHLREGALLHTVSGPMTIEKLEQTPASSAWYDVSYNLQVDDFHTFFVGENQVLVHHLSMLSILDEGSSKLPGL